MEIPGVREMKFGPDQQVVVQSNPPQQVLSDPDPQAVDPGPSGPNDAMLNEIFAQAKQRMMQPPPNVEQSVPQPSEPVYHSSGFQITSSETNQSVGDSSWWKNMFYFLPALALVFIKK